MTEWPLKDAEARFGDLLAACRREGPQTVTEDGAAAAVLVPVDEWRRLSAADRPSLKALLLAKTPQGEIPVPQRGRLRRREFEPPT